MNPLTRFYPPTPTVEAYPAGHPDDIRRCDLCGEAKWNSAPPREGTMHSVSFPCLLIRTDGTELLIHFGELAIAIQSGLTLDERLITQNFDVIDLNDSQKNPITYLIDRLATSNLGKNGVFLTLKDRLDTLKGHYRVAGRSDVFKLFTGRCIVKVFEYIYSNNFFLVSSIGLNQPSLSSSTSQNLPASSSSSTS